MKGTVHVKCVLKFIQEAILQYQWVLSPLSNNLQLVIADRKRVLFTDLDSNHSSEVQSDRNMRKNSNLSFRHQTSHYLCLRAFDQPAILSMHKRLYDFLAISDDWLIRLHVFDWFAIPVLQWLYPPSFFAFFGLEDQRFPGDAFIELFFGIFDVTEA